MAEQYTPQQRQALFAQATRQNMQMIPQGTATGGATTLQFNLPKARLLSKLWVEFTAVVKVSHASKADFPVDALTPYKIIRRLQLDLNNGFSPFVIGGKELALLNCVRQCPENVLYSADARKNQADAICYMSDTKTGKDITLHFMMEMPVTLNDRDLIGLILLQSSETVVTLTVDIGNGADLLTTEETGYSVEIKSVKVNPMAETFSVPAVQSAFPDISVLKLVSSRTEAFTGAGQNIIKLATGTIYRKLMLYITDDCGVPFENDDILSNIDLVFNQADVNYSIKPSMLRGVNQSHLGFMLPKGCYLFDFTYQGVPNYGGTRDYIDTGLLTEFWVRFNSQKSGKVSIISENLSKLTMSGQ